MLVGNHQADLALRTVLLRRKGVSTRRKTRLTVPSATGHNNLSGRQSLATST